MKYTPNFAAAQNQQKEISTSQRTFERILAPKQWKLFEGIRVENTTNKIRRVIITIPEV